MQRLVVSADSAVFVVPLPCRFPKPRLLSENILSMARASSSWWSVCSRKFISARRPEKTRGPVDGGGVVITLFPRNSNLAGFFRMAE